MERIAHQVCDGGVKLTMSALACTLCWNCLTTRLAYLHLPYPTFTSFVPAVARSSGMLQENGPLVSLLQRLQATLDSGKMAVVICPRAALVSEKYVRTRMRMWGAIAKYKVQQQFPCILLVLQSMHEIIILNVLLNGAWPACNNDSMEFDLKLACYFPNAYVGFGMRQDCFAIRAVVHKR